MPSEDHSDTGDIPRDMIIEDCNEDTLRIMVSSDNHLGYLENDPVRGDDSFAALEEVLFLAKHYKCDLVLLTGDLFHEKKPSFLTVCRAIKIFRRYCIGNNPVSIQIVSDQEKNFRRGLVNYKDEGHSIDLPVMSIHGHHDSPFIGHTTEEGSHPLAALDFLDNANLVNYIGKQENKEKVEVTPILIKKGNSRIALYAMGSMMEEHFDRLCEQGKVAFLQPLDSAAHKNTECFNIFALHQKRSTTGRPSKGCVREKRIPEWMDLVIWGSEHECLIEVSRRNASAKSLTVPCPHSPPIFNV